MGCAMGSQNGLWPVSQDSIEKMRRERLIFIAAVKQATSENWHLVEESRHVLCECRRALGEQIPGAGRVIASAADFS